ncbi:hypothetical protein [Actinomadura bangladeshensis]|uniref:Uncharacterized protein n=1 Tax=Actinomadura bangladeshensis TaxID=453573 RepID=A0A6L9QC33_9ACTN|nr:hypothetical protein [Actinomadura bangladeshensis]NEA22805.1 hypothetical protein [Actinomadura bangladeshensis]
MSEEAPQEPTPSPGDQTPPRSDPQVEAAHISGKAVVRAAMVTGALGVAGVLVTTLLTGMLQYSGPGAKPEPTVTVTRTVEAGAAASPAPATASPQAEMSPAWPGEPAGVIFNTGNPALEPSSEGNLDYEENDLTAHMFATSEYDVEAGDDGLGGINGAAFAPAPGRSKPTLKACRSIAEGAWVASIDVERFKAPSMFCVRSEEQRLGYLTTRGVAYWSEKKGDVRELSFTYVLWKKPGDR